VTDAPTGYVPPKDDDEREAEYAEALDQYDPANPNQED
jgi:hypothetical protein